MIFGLLDRPSREERKFEHLIAERERLHSELEEVINEINHVAEKVKRRKLEREAEEISRVGKFDII